MSSDALLAEQLELLGISSGFKSPEVELESARSSRRHFPRLTFGLISVRAVW